MDALAVLPNDKHNLPELYKPLMNRLVREFKQEKLVPMKQGGHALASGVLRGSRDLSDVIDDSDLVTLLNDGRSAPIWVANPHQKNQHEDNFLAMLDIDEWRAVDLMSAVLCLSDMARKEWMDKKDDAWHRILYILLADRYDSIKWCDEHKSRIAIENSEIVRCSDKVYRKGSKCFLPTDDMEIDKWFPRVAKGVYSSGNTTDKKAKMFLLDIGVRDVDERVEVEAILKRYYAAESKRPNRKLHYGHLRKFIHFLQEHPREIDMFKESYLFMIDCKREIEWERPSSIYIDSPFKETGLRSYYQMKRIGGRKHPLSRAYKKSRIKLECIRHMAKSIGVSMLLPIEMTTVVNRHPEWSAMSRSGGKRNTGKGVDEDYHIPWLKEYLASPSLSKSYLVWQTMTELCNGYRCQYLQARFGRNKSQVRPWYSTLVHDLRSIKWIPQLEGDKLVYVNPFRATANKLPKDFTFDPEWGDRPIWLVEIDFGNECRKTSMARMHHENIFKQAGFSSQEEAEEMARMKKEDPEGFRKWKESRKKTVAFPERPVANPERRQGRLQEQLCDAPDKKYERRKRSVRTTSGTIDATIWLREQYTNANGEMVCQMCNEEMPFRKRDGEYYFEKKEVLSNKFLSKEHEAQYLALCPVCAAKYQEYVISDQEKMKRLIQDILAAEDCVVPVTLGDHRVDIRYVQSHFYDLKHIIARDASSSLQDGEGAI